MTDDAAELRAALAALVRDLLKAGFTEGQAKTLAGALVRAIRAALTTRAD
jgi:hypothetical protein